MNRTTWVPKSWELPDSIRRRLGENVGRQRLMDEDGHLLLILHAVPKPEDDEVRHAALFWRQPAGEWKSSPGGGGLSALEAHITSYKAAIHALDEKAEAGRTPRDFFQVLRAVGPIGRSTRHLLAVVQEARDARPDETRLITLRDQAADCERAAELTEREARTGMELAMAEISELQAQAAHSASEEARRLNRLAAFFFPLATLVAVFGMNSPEEMVLDPGFWAVLVVGILIGMFVGLVVMRPAAR